MKRRVAYFLLCLCFCFSTLSLSSSAVEYDPYTGFEFDFDTDKYYDPYTGQEMIHENDSVWYAPELPLEYEPFVLYRMSSPNYLDFEITDLPWIEMPSYVQEIMTAAKVPSGRIDISSYTGDYKIPFMAVIVFEETVHVIAGYNLCVGAYFQNKTQRTDGTPYRYFLAAIKHHTKLYENAVCYYASYNRYDYSIDTAWKSLEPVAVGSNIVRYYNFHFEEGDRDSYFYGWTGTYPDRSLETVYIEPSETYPQYVFSNDPTAGFASGNIMFLPDVWDGYIGTFTPPTVEQQQASTSKSILQTLIDIPLAIADYIYTIFMPEEGFFDAYTAEFQNYFKDRFGFLYEVPDLLISYFEMLSNLNPVESDYSISFPEVVLPVLVDGEWQNVVIIENTNIKFDFLKQGNFKVLYDMYCDLCWFIYVFALLNLIYRKAERFFGGTTE